MDVIFSMMGITSLDWWPNPERPRLIEWPGEGSGHPSWKAKADRMRDGKGAMLPRLFAEYGVPDGARVAFVGFSAGSNSGLRAVLQSRQDRARIDFVGSFDGLHLTLKDKSVWDPAKPLSPFFADQVDGFVDYAMGAAEGMRGMVITSSDVAAPPVSSGLPLSQTKFVQRRILEAVGAELGRLQPPADPYTEMRKLPTDAIIPPAVVGQLQQAGGTPMLDQTIGNLVTTASPGRDQEAHITQARVFVPTLLKLTLARQWRAKLTV